MQTLRDPFDKQRTYVDSDPTEPSSNMNVVKALFTSNFWWSGLAITRYIPRSFRVKRVNGDSFYTEEKRMEFRLRVQGITENAARQWGTMSVGQMLHHLNLACGSSLGFFSLPDESYFVSRSIFKWILVDWFSEQPVGLRLPAGFKVPHEEQFDFKHEQQQLLVILDRASRMRSELDWQAHCMFGSMTPREWGKLLLIHADYHLRQFAS